MLVSALPVFSQLWHHLLAHTAAAGDMKEKAHTFFLHSFMSVAIFRQAAKYNYSKGVQQYVTRSQGFLQQSYTERYKGSLGM